MGYFLVCFLCFEFFNVFEIRNPIFLSFSKCLFFILLFVPYMCFWILELYGVCFSFEYFLKNSFFYQYINLWSVHYSFLKAHFIDFW